MKLCGRIVVAFLSGTLLVASLAASQGPPSPPPPPAPPVQPRDAGPSPTGTAVLSGLVVNDDQIGHPVRRAMVTMSGAALGTPRMVATDENGRFTFSSLPAGQVTVSVRKLGYVDMTYGARRSGRGAGSPITLADRQSVTNVVIRLPHGAAVTGSVTNSNGRPVPNVRLAALEYRMINGERTLSQVTGYGSSSASSDDRGFYRIYGLPAGEYVIAAQPFDGGDDLRPITAADIQWAQAQVLRAINGLNGAGVPATGPASSQPPDPAPPTGYAKVFYPGTIDIASASTISVAAGEERTGVDIPLLHVPIARIEGTVTDSDGRPAQAILVLQRNGQPASLPGSGFFRTNPDGKFTIGNVAPGDYTIVARTNPAPAPPPVPPPGPRPGGISSAPSPVAPPSAAFQSQWATASISVNGQDLTGLGLSLQPGFALSGRLAFDGLTAPPQDLTNVRLTFSQTAIPPGLPATAATTLAKPDGTFAVSGVMPGTYRLTVTTSGTALRGAGLAPPWFLKSVTVSDRDVTDRTFTIQPNEPLNNVVLTYSDRPSEISGAILDSAGKPAPGYTVLLFTTDQRFWGLSSRRIAQARPAAESGSFRFSNLLAGEYYLSALVSLDASDLSDPIFFEQLVNASLKVVIGDGEKKTQDLKLAQR